MTDTPTRTPTFGLLVLGSGPAGISAAAAYVAAGGAGPVRVVSADVDPPYQRPPLSKDVLAGEQPVEGTPILDDEGALDGVDVRLGSRVTRLDTDDRVVRLEDGTTCAYERLVVATGSTPRPLPVAEPGAEVLVLRSLTDARVLTEAADHARTAVVVGSGFIGCEAAASLAGRGVRTTLVTPEDQPQQARLGDWAGARIAEWLRAAGVDLRTGREVASVAAPRRVELDDGSVLEPDLVLAAVGVDQQQGFLEDAGLRLEDGRVLVDTRLRTSHDRVWAAGDVSRAHHAVADRPIAVEHWGDALTMGDLAGRNAAADASASGAAGQQTGEEWSDPPGFWSIIGPHTLKYAAWGDGHDQVRVAEHDDGAFTVWYADAAGELVGVLTHERDEDYERGGELLARRATLAQAQEAAQESDQEADQESDRQEAHPG